MNLVRVLQIFIQVGYLKVRAWFVVIDGLSLSEILGTSFIYRFIRAILPAERKIVPIYSRAIAILAKMTQDSKLSKISEVELAFSVKEESDQETENDEEIDEYVYVIVDRQLIIPLISKEPVYVHSTGAVLMRIISHMRLMRSCVAIVVQ